FLAVNAFLFVLLVSFEADGRPRLGRRRHATRAENWKAGAGTMQLHYLDMKLRPLWALALILTEAVLLGLNFYWPWVPLPVMISATALLVPLGLRLVERTGFFGGG